MNLVTDKELIKEWTRSMSGQTVKDIRPYSFNVSGNAIQSKIGDQLLFGSLMVYNSNASAMNIGVNSGKNEYPVNNYATFSFSLSQGVHTYENMFFADINILSNAIYARVHFIGYLIDF